MFLYHIRFSLTSSLTMCHCLGLSSLFPLFPSLLIRQGSVTAGGIQVVALSKLSFFRIIV
jgi:hypothetical protein